MMDLRDYYRLLRRGALIILASIVAFGVLGVLYLQASPKIYLATASVLAVPDDPPSFGELQAGTSYAQSASGTVATLVRTPLVLEQAAAQLHNDGLAGITDRDLRGAAYATSAQGSTVISISANYSDPEIAAAIANAVATSATELVPELVSSRRNGERALLRLRVVDQAVAPSAPVSPDVRRVMVLFVALGLAIGLVVALIRQSLDSRLRRAEDVAEITDVPILATLSAGPRSSRGGLVVRDATQGVAVEGYRVLRTNLGMQSPGRCRRILVTAASSGVGAAEVPANLAWSLARAGRKVLLVDLDLRSNSVKQLIQLSSSDGVVGALIDGSDPTEVIVSITGSTLHVLPSGSTTDTPSDLLAGPALSRLLDRVSPAYDDLIVHAPGLLGYTDAAEVARLVDQVIVIVRVAKTREDDLVGALAVLRNVGVEPRGLVMDLGRRFVAPSLRTSRTRGPRSGVPRSAGQRRAKS